MDSFRVEFEPTAIRDLQEIYDFVAARADDVVAERYVDRIHDACEALAHAPQRGTLRRELGENVRTIGFERRVTILFAVSVAEKLVVILGVLYGGRDVARAAARLG